MSRRPLCFAIALVLAVNAAVLAGVARNRSGSPEAALTLTERELILSAGPNREENSGVALELVINNSDLPHDWFNRSKLAEVGFDIGPQVESPEPGHRGNSYLPRRAFVVLEYEGDAWERHRAKKVEELAKLREDLRQGKIEKEQAENQQTQIEAALRSDSRLFVVDAGGDPDLLRARYPDGGRFVVVSAVVRVNDSWEDGRQTLRGFVSEILPDTLHVPRNLNATLLALPAEGRLSRYRYYQPGQVPRPRYEVNVAWGKRLEPWVAGVERMEQVDR